MKYTFSEIPGWTFQIHEVSAGIYAAEGIDNNGRVVGRTGADPDILLAKCKADALDILRQLEEKKLSRSAE